VRLFADTLVRICKGEILQAQTRWKVPQHDVYEERIYGKTAALFEAAAVAAALLTHEDQTVVEAMGDFGRDLGLAFQIVDDALDFLGTNEQLGKPAGHDMSQGIFNLPIVFYVEAGYISERELVKKLEDPGGFAAIIEDLRSTGMV